MTGRVATTVTFLETTDPPKGPPLQPPEGVEVVRVLEPAVSFWRFLYETAGEPWLWTERRLEDDDAIRTMIRAEGRDLRVLWLHGQPAGFAELDLADPDAVELLYFGILPDFVGRGLGRYFLDWTVRHAFAKGARRLWLHTCDLDAPQALANYEARGLAPYDREADEVPVIEGMGLPAHVGNRPIRPPHD
ncbi:MAG: GNAT family N-acetyltransferase [Geminicoccaceae bacterium]|nr:GNAT family N-acetyltransferase [Geminicoccaceae bacterium]